MVKMMTSTVASRKFGSLLAAADEGPVAIMKNGRPCVVVLSASLFDDYEAAYQRERDERFLTMIQRSLDLLKDGKLGKGQRALALARRLRLNEEQPGDDRAAEAVMKERAE
jgi:prevent-host-death family protein